MAWWSLDGLPQGPVATWRELGRLSSLYRMPPFPSPAPSHRVRRNLRRKGSINGWRQNLEPSNFIEMLPPSGFTGLIPPSHFQARPLPTVPRMAPTWASDIHLVPPTANQDVLERPRVTMWRQNVSGDAQGPGMQSRFLELGDSHALSQQAELISRQLQDLRRLEDEARVLRETSLQQKMKLDAQAMELEALTLAEKAGRAEAEGLRAALAGAELVRKNLEEGNKRELEEFQRLHQEQLLSLTQAHQGALSSLISKAEGLEKSLSSLEMRRAGEAKELALAQKEGELLRRQLSKTQEELEAQVTLVENLRNYVGEQVPPEAHSQAWEPERRELLDTVQHLQEDRDGLQATVELLEVRVQSLTHMLTLQEEELIRKVAELQERLTAQSQELAILQRALQDKAAEVEVERMGAKALRMELNRTQEAKRRQQELTASTEEQLERLASAVSSSEISFQNTVTKLDRAVARLPSLSNRLSYAVRQVHTIQGLMARKLAVAQLRLESCPLLPAPPPLDLDLNLELQQLREERNRLDAELQLSAHLIQQEVGRAREQGEAERRQLSEVAQQLEQELQCAQESLVSVGQQLEAARRGQQESTEEAASLRKELTQQQEIYGQALQEKVAEVETRLREQLSDTERRLNEAKREQAKAVVSLRQIQRKATREKERNQELRRLQEEARKEEGQRLTLRLQELEKDKNLLLVGAAGSSPPLPGGLATLQQEGLLSHYKQQRLLAVLPSPLDEEKSVESGPRPPGSSIPISPPAAARSTRGSIKASLSVLLDNLQGLSEAISKEEAVCQGDNQNTPALACT
uniref:coiled-coil alpha-helical rod protein 1 isoform X4 n=1 Tax=Jaculus jaculus TaxID=51337 RepID=UPI001E1B5637|nr:coiled-coil alpha-helical rod protein 1 isoform X4 [Jaculus jaculus]